MKYRIKERNSYFYPEIKKWFIWMSIRDYVRSVPLISDHSPQFDTGFRYEADARSQLMKIKTITEEAKKKLETKIIETGTLEELEFIEKI